MKRLFILLALALAGCAKATAIPVAANMVQISTDAAPVCGSTGAAGAASKQAAIETIRRGYDSYLVLGGEADKTKDAWFNGYGGGTRTKHHQSLLVKMFRNGEPGSENAIQAKMQLGANWKEIAQNGVMTCVD